MKSEKYFNNPIVRISSHPLPEDREEMISLWQTTFQDSDEFAEMFFSRVYKPENTLVIKIDGKIVSAMQMIPYKIKNGGDIIPSAYVCGVCTLTFERGKGLMKILMNEAMDEMRRKGNIISTLIPAHPWLFDIYKKFGYIYPANYSIEKFYHKNNLNKSDSGKDRDNGFSDFTFTPYSDKYFPYFDEKQQERQCAILHDAYDMENIHLDLLNDNGNIYIALHENVPVGIAFVSHDSEKEVVIKEILYDNTQTKEALIHYVLNIYNAETAKVRVPLQETPNQEINKITDSKIISNINQKTYPYGLACILDKRITDVTNLYMTLMLD